MVHKKTKIGLASIFALCGIFVILWLAYPSFLTSSVVKISFVEAESPEKKLIEVRLERDNLILDKKDKIQEKLELESELIKIDWKIQEIKGKMSSVQKSLDEVNNAVASTPEPNLWKIEDSYKAQLFQENTRYEKEKEMDQKLYIDTMNLIKKTYDDVVISIPETIPVEERKNRIEEAADLATTNRKNALQSLTDISLDHQNKHEQAINDLEEKMQMTLRDEKTKNEGILAPLIEKKQSISQQKMELQKEQESFLQQQVSITGALADIAESIRAIDLMVSGIDYKILMLEETIIQR